MGVLCHAVIGDASLGPVQSSLVLLLLLLLLLDGQGEGVAVAGLLDHHAQLWKQFSVQTAAPLQVCSLMRLEAVQIANPATLMSLNTSSFNIAAEMDAFRLRVQVNSEKFEVDQTLESERWTKLCLGVRPAHAAPMSLDFLSTSTIRPSPKPVYTVWLAAGDNFLNVTEVENYPLSPLSGIYSIGNYLSQTSFIGFVAAISTESIRTEMPPTNASCSEAVSEGESLSPWQRDSHVFFTEMEEQQLCSEQMHEITLYGAHGYSGFRRMCSSLGGHFPEVEKEVVGEVDNHTCVTEDGIASWLRGGSEEGEHVWSFCPVLFVNGTAGQRLCVQDLPCSKCFVPSALRYTLYGPVQDFDRQYSLKMLPDGAFYFEGRYTSNISRRDDGWTLWSRLHHRWWRLGQGTWPLGRRPWYTPHLNATLTFASCNVLQFPADEGTCLLRSQRCDSNKDHPDGSDERACRDRLIGKTSDYDRNMSPFEDQKNEQIQYKMILFSIGQITATQGIASIEMSLVSTWHDNRFRLVDVQQSLAKSRIFPCGDIWTPELYLTSGGFSGPRTSFIYIFRLCRWNQPNFLDMEVNMSDPLVGWMTSKNDETKLSMIAKMEVSSPCYFRLFRYPFGHYSCNTSIVVFPKPSLIKWKGRFEEVLYSGNRDLLDFHLDRVTLEPDDSNYTITLTLHLSGLADYHLLASFSPSGLMFLICYSTLHYPSQDFNERVMVSLTSLLVLVALFSQTSVSVKTPYYKLLDVWYVVLITLCFTVVISNSVVHMLQRVGKDTRKVTLDNDKPENDTDGKYVSKHAVRCNNICSFFLFFIFVVLVTVYVLIAMEFI